MECLSQESVGFEDVLSQMQDMLEPEVRVRCARWLVDLVGAVLCCMRLDVRLIAEVRGAGGTCSLAALGLCAGPTSAFMLTPPSLLPQDAGIFTLRDLKRSRSLAGTLFNIMFNLNKFIAFETRDPFVMRHVSDVHLLALVDWSAEWKTESAEPLMGSARCACPQGAITVQTRAPALTLGCCQLSFTQEREDGGSDWDRFARTEYIRLAVEEEQLEE